MTRRFPKIKGTFFGGPQVSIIVFGTYTGVLLLVDTAPISTLGNDCAKKGQSILLSSGCLQELGNHKCWRSTLYAPTTVTGWFRGMVVSACRGTPK